MKRLPLNCALVPSCCGSCGSCGSEMDCGLWTVNIGEELVGREGKGWWSVVV